MCSLLNIFQMHKKKKSYQRKENQIYLIQSNSYLLWEKNMVEKLNLQDEHSDSSHKVFQTNIETLYVKFKIHKLRRLILLRKTVFDIYTVNHVTNRCLILVLEMDL